MARRLCPPHAARMEVVPKVTFAHLGKTVEFESGKLPYHEHGKPESILDVALNFGINLEHACGGVCACTTCHLHVTKGKENLSPEEDDELDRLDMAADPQLNSRLGCQAVIKGDITVDMPGWNRNYVSEGGGSLNLGSAIPPPKNPATSAPE
jgi:ferredoxin, 2Fe-2S